MAANKAVWVRAAWQYLTSQPRRDVMVGVDGKYVIIRQLGSHECVVFSREDWAKLFWMVKRQIEQMESEEERSDELGVEEASNE